MKSNKKTNRAKNRKLTMISFLPAIIWLILLLVLSSQNGPQTAATSLPVAEWIQQHFFPQDSVDYVHMYLRKWAHFIVYFIESGLLVLAMKNVMKARQQRGLLTKVERRVV